MPPNSIPGTPPYSAAKRSSSDNNNNAGKTPGLFSSPSSILFGLLLSLGLGALAGFATFAFLYEKECSALINNTQSGAVEQARAAVQRQLDECKFQTQAYQVQLDQATKLVEDETARLNAQHGTQLTNIQYQFQEQLIKYQQRIRELEQSLVDYENETNSRNIDNKSKEKSLAQEITRLENALAEFQNVAADKTTTDQRLYTLQKALQQRFLAQTRLKYGNDNTLLRVDLTLDFGTGDLQTIVVEIDRLEEMPMTTATFLYLLEAGLYTGTRLQRSRTLHGDDDARILLGGQVTEDSDRRTARWQAHGYARDSPLLWINEATAQQAPCPRYGFGLDWFARGAGDFFISLPDLSTNHQHQPHNRPCLGRVVTGRNWLTTETHGTLAHARIRAVDEKANGGDEL